MGHDFLILIIKFEYRIYDIAIPNLILTLIYSAKYHEENVNLTRNVLNTVLPMGMTVVKDFKR